MSQVRVAPVHAPGRNDGKRRPALLKRADLDRRGVRAQEACVGEVERIVHRARRVTGRDVERLEVVKVILDLRTRGDIEPGRAKQGLDPKPRRGQRMKAPGFLAAARQRCSASRGAKLAIKIRARKWIVAPP